MARNMLERGATLTGYALIMAGMVTVSLGAVQGLDRGSTEVLESTGDSIGESRPTRDELAASIAEEEPGGDINQPDPEPTPTYNWQSNYTGIIETPTGLCVGDDGGVVMTVACSTSTSSSAVFFDNADDATDQVQIRIDGMCVTRIATNSLAQLVACQDGNVDQMWLQTPSGNLANGGAPGECLDVDAPNAGSAGADMFVWECHGGANQTFTFPGPYVPPVVEVTSVAASDATLTGAFQLDGNGMVYAPDGSGRSLDTPGTIGTATFTFTVADAGQYKMSGTVVAPNGNDDSFWVTTSLDGDTAAYKWGLSGGSSPHADFVNTNNGGGPDVILDIPAGTTFTITLSVREDNARLGDFTLVPA